MDVTADDKTPLMNKTYSRKRNTLLALLLIGVIISAVLIGYCVEFFLHRCQGNAKEDTAIADLLIRSVSAKNIEENLKVLSAVPHLAGTPEGLKTAEYVRDKWLEQGLDSAKLVPYNVMLSYPNPDLPNKVSLLENGTEIFHSALEEKILRPEDDNPNIVPPFNAYSYQGEIEGNLVYVNYGRHEDFKYLQENYPEININGSIVIVKYGYLFRGTKVKLAQKAGAIGVILYSDPAEYALEGESYVYPSSWWLPGTGVQRGNVFDSDAKGDPVTPGYPAKPYMYRLDDEDTALPKIPVHPIGYDDARRFLREMTGPEVPNDWRGNLNITYRLGPGFTNTNRKVKLSVHSSREQRTVYNVIGTITGKTEPDRYVILGNHRDAWVYGAMDPSSGTASLLEITRAYGELIVSGRWRPRRTIIFASWDAEEYQLQGSTEYVEEFQSSLADRAVAYINVDLSLVGNYSLYARGTPLLYQAIFAATKKVADPDGTADSLYDSWLAKSAPGADKPSVADLGTGSDFEPFVYRIGVSALDMTYSYDWKKIKYYPVYHSSYETFYCVKTFVDSNFLRSQAVAQVWAEVGRHLGDAVVLPMDTREYGIRLRQAMDAIRELYADKMEQQDIYFDDIYSALDNFTSATERFQTEMDQVNKDNQLEVRNVNDRLMNLERSFIDPLGLPDRKYLRHVVFAPSEHDQYSSSAFPGLVDAMFEIDSDPRPEERWDVVRQQMAVIAYTIQSAAYALLGVACI
ncbi:putative N-acetylated-alpha-linked acidic dipeptidase [Amphiura filiformis]|uniref:putative N-acetylated-alpha-linked acidic dipeptidase n=1 Tax=Amphiura filiformis TaxID=82378 RepID=UPI003B2103A0